MASVRSSNVNRSKVTVACVACRKRRAKCSGTQPCELCSKNELQCSFNAQQSKRRGPRPHKNGPRPVVNRPLAPAPAAAPLEPPSAVLPAAVTSPLEVNHIVGRQLPASPKSSDALQLNEDGSLLQPLSSDDEPDDEVRMMEIPPLETWQPHLNVLLKRGNICPASLSCDLLAHMVELFWQTANYGLRLMIDQQSFFQDIMSESTDIRLCIAMCANSANYSCHSTMTGADKGAFADICEKLSRSHHLIHSRPITIYDIQASFILADTMTRRGCGAQGWTDLARAKSLLQLFRMDSMQNQISSDAFSRLDVYLSLTELQYAVGNVALYNPCLPFYSPITTGMSRSQLLHKLLDLCVRIQLLCQEPLTRQHPPPWTPHSAFRRLQEELEDYPIRRTADFRFDADGPDDESEEDCVFRMSCTLLWHCCVVMLNRHFLPIPRMRPHSNDPQPQFNNHSWFPFAPELFLKERVLVCESSAVALCMISTQLVTRGFIFMNSVFIGYALYHGGLILLNQLHCRSRLEENHVLDNLKVVFTILGTLKNIYAPAHAWISNLFFIYDSNNIRQDVDEVPETVFGSFYGRLIGTQEVGMVTWWPPEPKPVSDRPSPAAKETTTAASSADDNDNATLESRHAKAWVKSYTAYLDEDILSDKIAAAQTSNIGDNDIVSITSNQDAAPLMEDSELHGLAGGVSNSGVDIPLDFDGMTSLDFIPQSDLLNHLQLGDQLWTDLLDNMAFEPSLLA